MRSRKPRAIPARILRQIDATGFSPCLPTLSGFTGIIELLTEVFGIPVDELAVCAPFAVEKSTDCPKSSFGFRVAVVGLPNALKIREIRAD